MKQKPGIATRAVLLAVSLLWAIPLIWSVLTALKPSKESMLLQLPSTLTLENFQVVFESAPFLQYGLNTFLIVAGILAVQLITVTMGAYALACVNFRGKGLAMALIMVQIIIPADVLILPMTDDLAPAISLATQLREAGIRTQLHCEKKKFKAKITYASKLQIPFVIFLGEDEVQSGNITYKNLSTGVQQTEPPQAAIAAIQSELAQRNAGKPIQERA